MLGVNVSSKFKDAARDQLSIIDLTPEVAMELLEHNRCNRPITDSHVKRISAQILAGKWKFNGDTIKVSDNSEILDGQHRLWAVVDSKRSVKTAIIYGIPKDAFSTIDTIRRPRSGADTASLAGVTRYRAAVAGVLTWLLRYQRGVLENYRQPENRIENSDIQSALANHENVIQAIDKAQGVRRLCNINLISFLYYVMSNRDSEIADRMINTLLDPSGIAMSDPFFMFRVYLQNMKNTGRPLDPLMTIALAFKAANAISRGDTIKGLFWKSTGKTPEPFPVLRI